VPLRYKAYHHWWLAQTYAYMVRPNKRTLAKIAEVKDRIFHGGRIAPGTVSIHVRHGDKFVEDPPVRVTLPKWGQTGCLSNNRIQQEVGYQPWPWKE
jgi:hypothetical protein